MAERNSNSELRTGDPDEGTAHASGDDADADLFLGDSDEGRAHESIGDTDADLSVGQYREVIELHYQQLRSALQSGDRQQQVAAYWNLGYLFDALGHFRKAIEMLKQLLRISQEAGDQRGEGAAYSNIGCAYQSLGEYGTAIKMHEKRLAIALKIGDRQGEGRSYGNLGNAYESLGDYQQAIKMHEKHLGIALESGNRGEAGGVWGNIGNAYQSLEEFRTAIEMHEKQLAAALEVGDREGEGTAYSSLGCSQQSLGEYRRAIELHKKHLKVTLEIGDRKMEGAAYGNIGCAYQRVGEYREAIEMLEKHLAIALEIGDRLGEVGVYGNLGNANMLMGEYKRAIHLYEKELQTALEMGSRREEGRAHGHIGCAYQSLGEYKRAMEMHEKELAIALETGDRGTAGTAYCNIGLALKSQGQYHRAIEMYEKQLALAVEIEDRNGESIAYGNLGNVKMVLGEFRKAIECHEKLLHIALKTGDQRAESAAYGNIGVAYDAMGEYRKAIELQEKVLAIAVTTGDRRGEGQAYGCMGVSHHSLGQHGKAIELHKKHLKIALSLGDRGGEGSAYGNLGNVYQSKGEFKTAMEMHEKLLEIALVAGNRSGEGTAYGNTGRVYRSLGEFRRAIEMYERQLAIAEELGDVVGQFVALYNLGDAYECEQDMAKAVEAAWGALSKTHLVESSLGEGFDQHRLTFFETQSRVYHLNQRLFRSMGRHELALAVSEMSKARALWHLMLGDSALYSRDVTSSALEGAEKEWVQVSDMVRELGCTVVAFSFLDAHEETLAVWAVSGEGKLLSAEMVETGESGGELRGLLSVIEAAFEAPAAATVYTSAMGREQARQVVNPEDTEGSALLAWAAALGDPGAGWEPFADAECDARRWRGLLAWGSEAERSQGELRQKIRAVPQLVLEELHRRLVAPVAAALEGVTEVLLVPQRGLFRVPWGALRGEDGVHLIQRHALRVAPSLRVALTAQRRRAALASVSPQSAVVVGNPWPIASETCQELPGAEGEADVVEACLQQTGRFQVQVLKREAATVAALAQAAEGAGWVHLACHGAVHSTRNAIWGEDVAHHLLLAREEGEQGSSGELSTAEAQQLKLAHGATVALSCCQSGLGEMTGEGVIGLSRSFFAAGAGAMVVALCSIPDSSAAQIVQQVYQLHHADGLSLSSAMQQAVLRLADLPPISQRGVGVASHAQSAPFQPPASQETRGRKGVATTTRKATGMTWTAWGGFQVVG